MRDVATVWKQLVVDRRDPIAPYQQLAASIRHKIATLQVRSGDPAPSVRDLAKHVGVTTATVSRAYRALQAEGLLEPRTGVGTVVADVTKLTSDPLMQAADGLAEQVAEQARDLGIDGAYLVRALQRRLAAQAAERSLLFIGGTPAVCRKYEAILAAHVSTLNVRVRTALIDEVLDAPADVADVEHAITILSYYRDVSTALAPLGVPVTVLLTELNLRTNARLDALPRSARVALVAERAYRTTGLGMVQPYCSDQPIEVARSLDPSTLADLIEHVDVVVHTLGTSDVVKEVVVGRIPTIELEFQPRQDSLQQIVDLLSGPTPTMEPGARYGTDALDPTVEAMGGTA